MPRYLNKTPIEWADLTWNPLTGCLYGCEYCYARTWARRFGKLFSGREFIPQFHPERLSAPIKYQKPSLIFVCSMGELFAPWVDPMWVAKILLIIRQAKQHTFVALTKQPHMVRYSLPENLWFGTSVDDWHGLYRLQDLQKAQAKVTIACFEPLLTDMIHLQREVHLAGVGWVIIGGLTRGRKVVHPERAWIERILSESKGIPVFIKDNAGWPEVVRNWPVVRRP